MESSKRGAGPSRAGSPAQVGMAAGTCAALRKRLPVGSCSGVGSLAAPGKERAQPELRGCGRGRRTQPSPALPRQGQAPGAQGTEHGHRGGIPSCARGQEWDGARLAAGSSPRAQVCHSPSCNGCNCCGSAGCCAGAAAGPFCFLPRSTLKKLNTLPAIPLSDLEGTLQTDVSLGKGPSQRVPRSGREASRRSNAWAKLRVRQERAGCAGAPHSAALSVLSRRVHRALWRGRVAASACVSACHKGLLGHPVPLGSTVTVLHRGTVTVSQRALGHAATCPGATPSPPEVPLVGRNPLPRVSNTAQDTPSPAQCSGKDSPRCLARTAQLGAGPGAEQLPASKRQTHLAKSKNTPDREDGISVCIKAFEFTAL